MNQMEKNGPTFLLFRHTPPPVFHFYLPSWLCDFPTTSLLRHFVSYPLTNDTPKSLFLRTTCSYWLFHSLTSGLPLHMSRTIFTQPAEYSFLKMDAVCSSKYWQQRKATFTSTMHHHPRADQHHRTALRSDRGVVVVVDIVVVGFVFVCVCVCVCVFCSSLCS
jgi:hypothetical protein